MSDRRDKRDKRIGGLEGILSGITDLVEKLGELAETGKKLSRSGQFQGKGTRSTARRFSFPILMPSKRCRSHAIISMS